MDELQPFVRHILLCDDVVPSPTNPNRLDLFGLTHVIYADFFPCRHERLTVFLQLSALRRAGMGQVVVWDTAADNDIRFTGRVPVPAGRDPLHVLGLQFRLEPITFAHAGLYWVEFRYNDKSLAYQTLEVRMRSP